MQSSLDQSSKAISVTQQFNRVPLAGAAPEEAEKHLSPQPRKQVKYTYFLPV